MVCVLSFMLYFFLMIRRPPRSTLDRSSAASDVYKRQMAIGDEAELYLAVVAEDGDAHADIAALRHPEHLLSLIHISEPTRPY